MVSMDRVKTGLTRYLDAEFAPKLPRGDLRQNIKAGGVIAWCVYAISHLDLLLPAYAAKAGLDKLGAINEDGIDVDGLLAAIRPQIGEGGMAVELPVLGELTIYPSDVDTLAKYIREA